MLTANRNFSRLSGRSWKTDWMLIIVFGNWKVIDFVYIKKIQLECIIYASMITPPLFYKIKLEYKYNMFYDLLRCEVNFINFNDIP